MTVSATTVRGDIDSPLPLRVQNAHLKLQGWCLLSGVPSPPAVRLHCADFTLSPSGEVKRTDLITQMLDEPAAGHCGFIFDALLPQGVHLAHLECEITRGTWQPFKALCLAVEPRLFTASLDVSDSVMEFDRRVHLDGWAIHPKKSIQSLKLRYGHRELACNLGRPRDDLPSLYPDTPHAKTAGFKSKDILGAGYGKLRFKAHFTDGAKAITRTPHRIAIDTDENIGPEINLQATRIGLPYSRPINTETSAKKPAKTSRSLNVLFVLHGSFASNSALHVTALANELAKQGHECVIAVTHDIATVEQYRNVHFKSVLHDDAKHRLPFADQAGPNIIHAWTPRENVRMLTDTLRRKYTSSKTVVHLEDNEQHLLSEELGLTVEQLNQTTDTELDHLITGDLSHPKRSREFLSSSDAVTIITENLRRFVPENHPCQLLWPAADESCFAPQQLPKQFRQIMNRCENETVLFYHGNVHASNASEVKELYLAVDQLNREGIPTTLIRTGLDKVDFLGGLSPQIAPHVLSLGQISHHHHLPALMSLADFFVQPGKSDAFNDYRFPSKLPEFFAIGRPVILPRSNLGTITRHRKDAYVLNSADASGISRAIKELRNDSRLREQLSQGALDFSREHFSWNRSAATLATFYEHLTR